MDLIITEKITENLNKTPTICLNMIVKNESHIIRGTLEKLCSKIKFSYWVICDTGSTDNTKEIIHDFFKSKNIKGELYVDEWKNFAHNRTLALQRAFQKTDLLLVFDADDEIVGDIEMPKAGNIIYDEYHLKFGSSSGTAYTRVLLINNKKRFMYQSVLHEFISCLEPNSTNTIIEGNYFVVSGRSGNRSQDPQKYLKDAKILEAAHAEALAANDPLYHRYSFYCANSYKDYGSFEEAIKWYKITLNQDNWEQERYVSCLYIYECYEKLNQRENGFFYLVKAFSYDTERVECLYPLLVHYCCEGQNKIAYNYYLNVKDYYENHYLTANIDKKLFVVMDKYNFYVPYYMILVADKVQDFDCVVKMFEIIFIKKHPIIDFWFIKNLLYNLQFFISHVKPDKMKQFIDLTDEYFHILHNAGVPLNTLDYLKEYDTRFGIDISYIFPKIIADKPIIFSKEECASSKNILFYTGFSEVDWNYSYMQNNALGGSEKAVAYLSKSFPKNYNIFVAGVVKPESFDNITYVKLADISQLIKTTAFHTVIVSRYISFYEMFSECSFYQSYIWAHDTQLLPYGCNLNENQILTKWNNYITGCICLTQWHKDQFISKYPELSNKITLINNGLDLDSFLNGNATNAKKNKKQSNKFIYSSRPERGLDILLGLWPQILDELPDAELVISNYGVEPESVIMNIIKKYDSIRYLGKLNTQQLYSEMSTSEYWLYPTHWPETSCITALEMLMSEVICLYYPVAGLPFTIDKYGIQIKPGNEIETIINLTTKAKKELRENGKVYAESCSWKNRANIWSKFLLNKKLILFFLPVWYDVNRLEDYFDSFKDTYDVVYTSDASYAYTLNPEKVHFVMYVSSEEVYKYFSDKNIETSILNSEPLNLTDRFLSLKNSIDKFKDIKIYDYSLSNIKILNTYGYTKTHHLEYNINDKETTFLKNINENTKKIYDFGIISIENPVTLKRRADVVNYLIKNNYSVKVIQGWKEERDRQIASCSVLLNIHGSLNSEKSDIFEHIRCDRLLAAGFNILSECSLYLDQRFINAYPTLKVINYEDFFTINTDTYKNLDFTNKQQQQQQQQQQQFSKKIIDGFTFYNEINMLTYRLNVLNDVVDYFILVEANQTHVGKPKPLFYNKNKHLFEKFNKKIIHIIVDLPFENDKINIANNEQWLNEKLQRNNISQGIDILKNRGQLNDEDCIIISDVDEIPDPTTLLQIKNGTAKIDNNAINVFEQDFYYYNLNSRRNEYWAHSRFVSYKKYKELGITCDNIRLLNYSNVEKIIIIKKGGWHLSYFGDAAFIKNKLENFAHQEFNSNTFTDVEKINKKINEGLDLFNRDDANKINGIQKISILNNAYLPPLYDTYLTEFYNKTEAKIEAKIEAKSKSKPKIFCVIHSCTLPATGTSVLDFIVKVINKTGFINVVDTVFINNIGIPIENKYNGSNDKYFVTNYSNNTKLFEYPSLNKIKKLAAQESNSYILYLHTKGITQSGQYLNNVNDWINMMLYFLVEKHEECIHQLNEGYDTVGCNYHLSRQQYPEHYSGNFWWSKSSYINKLHLLDETNVDKSYAEFWLFTSKPKYYTIHSSGDTNHYYDSYPMERYSHNSIIQQII
jgi:beta-1,4-mannosyl-glycoprotein beta-1,4-N-acetylglucosaminyltransferase